MNADVFNNLLSDEDRQKIWVPKLRLTNAVGTFRTDMEDDSMVYVARRENGSLPGFEEHREGG